MHIIYTKIAINFIEMKMQLKMRKVGGRFVPFVRKNLNDDFVPLPFTNKKMIPPTDGSGLFSQGTGLYSAPVGRGMDTKSMKDLAVEVRRKKIQNALKDLNL